MGIAERVEVIEGRPDVAQDGGLVERRGSLGVAQDVAERTRVAPEDEAGDANIAWQSPASTSSRG
jgi:hypothetical protein